jgi:DNA-binding GntR family transcriptional regulator
VAETIKGRIFSGEYKAGALIPPARELASEFEVSSITIRKAIEHLTQEGLVATRQGLGTTVIRDESPRVEINLSGNFREWLDSASGRRPRLEAEVLEITSVQPPDRVRDLLGLGPEEAAWQMKRIRRHRGEPVSYFINYGRREDCRHLKAEAVTAKSFIEVYQESSEMRLTRMEQTVQATAADMRLAEILETAFGAPMFFIENIYYCDQTPRLITHMHYRGDRYLYRTTIPLSGD